jgi:hypothetical protein
MFKVHGELVLLSLLVLASASAISAQVTKGERWRRYYQGDLSAQVSADSKIEYVDLLKLLFPDLSFEGGHAIATETIPLRHVSGDHKEIPLHGKFDIKSVNAVKLPDPHGARIILELGIATDVDNGMAYGAEADIVAAFQLSPTLKLLDALDVKTDRSTGLLGTLWPDSDPETRTLFRIKRDQDAFLIWNGHGDSDQRYEDISAFFLINDRLRSPVGGFLLSDHGFDTASNCETRTDEVAHFLSSADPGSPYYQITLRARVTTTFEGDACTSLRHKSRYYIGLWKWSRSTKDFVLSGGNLTRLGSFNRKRM